MFRTTVEPSVESVIRSRSGQPCIYAKMEAGHTVEYEDFLIQIGPAMSGVHTVSVQCPAGEGCARFENPFRPVDPDIHPLPASGSTVSGARDTLVGGGRNARSSGLQAQGTALFKSLFTGEILTLFHDSLSPLRTSGQGLRIRLRLDPRDRDCALLQDLPWELLCEGGTGDFLALSRRTPVVRVLDARRPVARVRRPQRLRILAVAAMPVGLPLLEGERELRDLSAAWEGQDVEVVRLARADREQLREALLQGPIHVLHFVGHGGVEAGEGRLFFEQPSGAAQPVDGRALAIELKDFKDLRLVILNACRTADAPGRGADPLAGVANALVLGGVPAVIAMRSSISDKAALAFGRAVSERLAAGDPIEAAVVEGRLAIHRLDERSEEWATPVLFLRGPDGQLFSEDVPPVGGTRAVWLGAGALGLTAATLVGLMLAPLRPSANSEALIHNNQGVALAADGRDVEARKAFLAAIAIDARYGAALSNLSALEERSGEIEGALRHARLAAENWPEDAVLQFNLGNLLARLGRDPEALERLERSVEIDPGYAEARNEIGLIYLRLDRPDIARRELEAGLRARPDLAPLHKNLARVALAEGRTREAVEHLERALSLYGKTDPKGVAETTYWLAMAFAAEGRSFEACRKLADIDSSALSGWASSAKRLAREEKCGP